MSVAELRGYLGDRQRLGDAPRTLAAHLSAIRSLYRWLNIEEIIDKDPAAALQSPKLPSTLPIVLSTSSLICYLMRSTVLPPGEFATAPCLNSL